MPRTPEEAAQIIMRYTPQACQEQNQFMAEVFQTRGGRIGSGMGGVIEALWGFYLNRILLREGVTDIQLAWIYGHEYNDFACIDIASEWDPETRQGELLRIEVKSMVASADESKAHFDRLSSEFLPDELLAVFLWDWAPSTATANLVHPRIHDQFINKATGVAALRDALHINRGGTFVVDGHCPDNCAPGTCSHVHEPLNSAGKRERISGPISTRGTGKSSYAANFGGLLRMLTSRGATAVTGARIIEEHMAANASANEYVRFMARNYSRISRRNKFET